MRLAFLQLPADERRLYVEEAAQRRGLSPSKGQGNAGPFLTSLC
jgi:hypothetical protein